jgi:oxygen-independent coproporphyrinogen III oxidase
MHLYLHIPFCKQACHYCDFHFSTSLAQKPALVAAICQEIILQKDYLPSSSLDTIYLGGGTPSLLTESELSQIFETIHQNFVVSADAEITLEANPDDLSAAKLYQIKPFVNRLSIGIQSFHDPYLKLMNRAHEASEGEASVRRAQEAGFENITIDLMYGFEDEQTWQTDLQKAIALQVPHISSYCLTIEERTVLGHWLKKRKIKPIDEDRAARQFEMLIDGLTNNGFEHYEISNFAKPNRYARHNSSYWKRRPYLGVGPSAHSYNGYQRQYNVANNALYIKEINKKNVPCEIENLTLFEQANDYLLTSLRTIWGCELEILNQILGFDFFVEQQTIVNDYLDKQWLICQDQTLYLTSQGKLFADRIASDLFLVE